MNARAHVPAAISVALTLSGVAFVPLAAAMESSEQRIRVRVPRLPHDSE